MSCAFSIVRRTDEVLRRRFDEYLLSAVRRASLISRPGPAAVALSAQ
jgi:hypothetical protein